MALVEAVLKGELSVSDAYRGRLATCTGCLACEAACASGVPVTEIIQAAKEQAVAESGPGLIARAVSAALKHGGIMTSLAWLAPVALHYSGASVRGGGTRRTDAGTPDKGARGQAAWGRGDAGTKAKKRVIFFPGCAVRYFQQDIEEAVRTVLTALGYEVIIPGGLQCCGRPLLSLGDRKAAEALALRNARLLSSVEAETIVTACASCGLTFKEEYPKLLTPHGAKPVPVLDIHEFLAGKTAELDFMPVPVRVTWHDPCHLGRGQGLANTARKVLLSVSGVDLAEMRDPDRCCGFGGVMRMTHPGLSSGIGSEKARNILKTGSSLVVTGCPGCRMQISDALRREGAKIGVVHTVQVLARALKEGRRGDGETRGRGERKREGEKVGK